MRRFIDNIKENFFAERDRWVVWLPVLFGLGIGLYFLFKNEPSKWITVIVVEALLVLAYIWRRNADRLLWVSAIFVVAMGYSDIQLRSIYQSKFIEAPQNNEITYLKGRILKTDHNIKGKVRLLLTDVSDYDNPRRGNFRITLASRSSSLDGGACVEMIATLMRPSSPALPGGYQFDRKAFFEGLSAVGYANSPVYQISCEKEPGIKDIMSYFINGLRKKVVKRIHQELPPDEAGIVAAIVAGERGGISQQITNHYRDAGLAHFLSISGLHMGMIAAMAFFIVRLLLALLPHVSLRYDSKKTAAVFAIFISFVYLLISGAAIPSQRAFITTFIVLLGILFSRRAISMRMVGFAALAVLVISPHALIGASFQMSFAAVVVLVAFYERYASPIHHYFAGKEIYKIVLAYFVGLLISDFVASLATLPFAIYHFNRIAVYTTLGNFLAGPIIGLIIMPFVLLALFMMPLGLETVPLKIVGFGVMLVNKITAYVSELPGAGFQVMSMPFWGLALIVIGGLWLCIWQRAWRRWGILPLIIGILSIFSVHKPDALYDATGKAIAVQDKQMNMVIMPGRSNKFIKQLWLEKTVSLPVVESEIKELKKIYAGQKIDLAWIDLKCTKDQCVYKNKFIWTKEGQIKISGKQRQTQRDGGGAIYFTGRDICVKTVREDIGYRLWNR